MALKKSCVPLKALMGSPGWHSLSPQNDERLHAVSLGDLSCRQKILAEAKRGLQGGQQGCLHGPEPCFSSSLACRGQKRDTRRIEGAPRLDPGTLSSGLLHPCCATVEKSQSLSGLHAHISRMEVTRESYLMGPMGG